MTEDKDGPLRLPAWCCQQCGEPIGYLGRAVDFLLGYVCGPLHDCTPTSRPSEDRDTRKG